MFCGVNIEKKLEKVSVLSIVKYILYIWPKLILTLLESLSKKHKFSQVHSLQRPGEPKIGAFDYLTNKGATYRKTATRRKGGTQFF